MQGRVAIVTGGASGIGRAIAHHLAQGGAQVVIADRDLAAGQASADEIGAHFIAADLCWAADCAQVVTETVERFGTVHILVNNAGMQHVAPIETFPEATWETMITLMLTAPFRLTRAVWPHMKAQGWGRIINISSIHGLVASPFKSAYVAAKHGLIGLTRTAALEGGADGITVNALCPGYVQTPLVEQQIADQAQALGIPEERVIDEVMLNPAAIKRLITPEEIAGLVGYLVSDAAAVVTGAAWTIDAGWTAR